MKKLLEEIRSATTAEAIETVSEKMNAYLLTANPHEREEIRKAASDLGKVLSEIGKNILTDTRKIVGIGEEKYDLAEWVTIREYARRFGIASTNVVTNWIRRGIVPKENVIEIDELNSLRLIKAVPYV